MQGWIHTIQGVVADDGIFPAHRIVERVDAGIAPVAIQMMPLQSGSGASNFKEAICGFDRDLGAEYFGGRHSELGMDDRRLGRFGHSAVDGQASLLEQCLGCLEPDRQIADDLDGVGSSQAWSTPLSTQGRLLPRTK